MTLEHFRVKTLLRTVTVPPSNEYEEIVKPNILRSQCKQLVMRTFADYTDYYFPFVLLFSPRN